MSLFLSTLQMGSQLLLLTVEKVKETYIQIESSKHYRAALTALTQRDLIECSNQTSNLLHSLESHLQLLNNADLKESQVETLN
jgi:hypothetical protein